MIYAFLTLLSLAAGAVILCCLAWTCGALLFVLALCKSAKLGDDAAKANPVSDLKGEATAKARGGNDAAPQLLSMNPKILRGFKTSLAVLLVACAVGCETKPKNDYLVVYHMRDGDKLLTGQTITSGRKFTSADVEWARDYVAKSNTNCSVVILNIIKLDK